MSKEVAEKTIFSKLESAEDVKILMRGRSMNADNYLLEESPPRAITEIKNTLIPPSISNRISKFYSVNVFLNLNVLMTFYFFDDQLFKVSIYSGRISSAEEFRRLGAELEKIIKDNYEFEITHIQNDPTIRA